MSQVDGVGVIEARCNVDLHKEGKRGVLGYISEREPMGLADGSNMEYKPRLMPTVCDQHS